MSYRKSEDTLFLIGGALLGAAAMYLLDPEAGDMRRKKIASAAEGAYSGVRDHVGDHLNFVAGQARQLADHLTHGVSEAHGSAAQYTQDLADHARGIAADLSSRAMGYVQTGQAFADQASKASGAYVDQAQDAGSQVRHWGDRLWNKATHLSDTLQGWRGTAESQVKDARRQANSQAQTLKDRVAANIQDARSKAGSWIAGEDARKGIGPATFVSGGLGFCLAGAGLMYFFDPTRGVTRRARIVGELNRCLARTGQIMRETGEDLAGRLQGMSRRARQFSGEYIGKPLGFDSNELISRIRLSVDDIPGLNVCQFMADGDGTVTVTGNLTADHLDTLLTRLHAVRGVTNVINRVDVQTPAHA